MDFKKYVGTGFIILLMILLINAVLSLLPFELDSWLFSARTYWFLFAYLIQIGAVSLIAFYPKSQSSIIAKIGGVLYVIFIVALFINQVLYYFTERYLISDPVVTIYLSAFVFYAPALLMLTWGSRLWLPAKTILTIDILLDVASEVIFANLIPMYQNLSEQANGLFSILQNVMDGLNYTSIVTTTLALILTIIWLCLKTKKPSIQSITGDTIQ